MDIKTLKKWKFKEKKIPSITYWCILFSILFLSLGILGNFTAIQKNNGKMPVIADFDYSSKEHFTIKDIDEVNYIYLGDIFPLWGSFWSIGDFLLIIGMILMLVAVYTKTHNHIFDWLIQKKKNE